MPATRPLMLESDPDRFFAALAITDPEERAQKLLPNPLDVFLGELILYGLTNNPAMVSRVSYAYDKLFLPAADEQRRYEIYTLIQGLVLERSRISPNVLFPFLIHDPARLIVATAALDLVALCPVEPGDPLSATRPLVQMIVNHSMVNRGAAFGGLLFFGDPRVCKLLWAIRDELGDEELGEVARSPTPFLRAASIDFLIDWLEDLQARGDENRFGFVVAALMNQMQTRQVDQVFTGERPIPDWSVNSTDRVVPSMSLAAYRKQIGPRLRAIARREADPKIMPMALQSWGV